MMPKSADRDAEIEASLVGGLEATFLPDAKGSVVAEILAPPSATGREPVGWPTAIPAEAGLNQPNVTAEETG